MEFGTVALRGMQLQVEEFVFMLDKIRLRLQEVIDISKVADGEADVQFALPKPKTDAAVPVNK
jgi:hypothetical protein